MPAVVLLTVNVAWPDALVATEAGAIVDGPPAPASVTFLPETTLPFASFSVTVTVEVVTPSAVTVLGAALTVDCAAVTGPGVYVTVAVFAMFVPSSFAVIVTGPAVVEEVSVAE